MDYETYDRSNPARYTYATVDEVISILIELSKDGKGDYIVGCLDGERYLAKKNEKPVICPHKEIDFCTWIPE